MSGYSNNNYPDVGNINTGDYNYDLPEERIAKYPLPRRDESKLLVWEKGHISEGRFYQLPDLLPQNAILVFNNTKVIRARLLFQKETGAKIEAFCLEPVDPSDYQLAFMQTCRADWKCFIGNAKKWKEGRLERPVKIGREEITLTAEMLKKGQNDYIVRFRWDKPYTFGEIIENTGVVPIPPYLNRETEESDKSRYQTVFAKIKGSVAAPTAGLHFSDEVLKKLDGNLIRKTELTLHVGAGTFHPVKAETIAGHIMHSEAVTVSKALVYELIQCGGNKIIAVGTTSVRSLESLYWLGVQLKKAKPGSPDFHISQWEPYSPGARPTKTEALEAIVDYMETELLEELHFSTQIIIAPGYTFNIIDGMLTNFHQPQSTLLLLVGAFLGGDWVKVYRYALDNDFRFLSYGDSNLYLT
ncbi:S-adenosylmethionine:tRNA ribosyltransferase-isomerase [hydrothermal vent metagenome]|uniref:S-adenosylmethionine:tRNA ribosyltransferase-isomerase n=1 Tax=hydrothermal vent metagenome TaxID=652676 RepID=A0A3B0U347_9ZZZZ